MNNVKSLNQANVHNDKICFAFIGHSGSGKSTLIDACVAEQDWPRPWRPHILRKCTTRSLRSANEKKELFSISRDIFLERQAVDALLAVYENHGELYGIEKSEIESVMPYEFSLISINTQAAITLKESTVFKLYVCLIEAEKHIRQQRLLERGNIETLEKLESRLEQQENPLRKSIANFILSSNGTLEETFRDVRTYIQSVLSSISTFHG